jgi:hypothetical protein
MTLSDTDLEARLRRDLRARADDVPPAPRDLAALTRERHRSLRRREYGVLASAVAAALVLVGVPVVASTLASDERGQTAGPTTPGDPVGADEGIYTIPTRGGLADEDDWLADVAALPWREEDASSPRDPGMELPEPPGDTRRVAYADDVPSGRVALVVGISNEEVVHAWFVGPRGADADEMTVANYPGMFGTDVVGLVDGESDAETLTLVVVANPGDVVDRHLIPEVDAEGTVVTAEGERLDLVDGIAVLPVDRRWAESGAPLFVQRSRDTSYGVAMSDSLRVGLARPSDVVPADPRGLAAAGATSEGQASSLGHILQQYGLTADEARPTLLAAGPIGSGRNAALLGITFPSGATGMWLATFVRDNSSTSVMSVDLPFAPAGTALLDRVIAVRTLGGLVVSASSGARADVLDASGAVLDSLPLSNGAGTGVLTDPNASTDVRIVDGAGNVVTEIPIIGPL